FSGRTAPHEYSLLRSLYCCYGRPRDVHSFPTRRSSDLDGVSMDYSEADLILVGVSRAGKTPTCVYLALHHGVRAANYPLTEDDLDRKSTRLNSSHVKISYAVFCLKKKKDFTDEQPLEQN